MFLVFPQSVTIPEALERMEDANFEDWLTATLIETGSQPSPEGRNANGTSPRSSRITDLWMLEIEERTAEVWAGKFQVELKNEDELHNDSGTEQRSGELAFAFDTRTAEITFETVAEKD
jgi:hypothetical protein